MKIQKNLSYVKSLFIHFWTSSINVGMCFGDFLQILSEECQRLWFFSLGWDTYNFLPPGCLMCASPKLSLVNTLFTFWGSHWHPLRLDSAPGSYEDIVQLSILMPFWYSGVIVSTKPTLASLRASLVQTEVTTDQLVSEQRFFIEITFDPDLWYFLTWIIY